MFAKTKRTLLRAEGVCVCAHAYEREREKWRMEAGNPPGVFPNLAFLI